MEKNTNLRPEHRSWWDFHVVTKLEILNKGESLSHAYISIYLEAHIRYRTPRVRVTNYVFCNDV